MVVSALRTEECQCEISISELKMTTYFLSNIPSNSIEHCLSIYDTLQGSLTNYPTNRTILMKSPIKYMFPESKQTWDPIFCGVNDINDFGVYTTMTQSCHLNFTQNLDLVFHLSLDFKNCCG